MNPSHHLMDITSSHSQVCRTNTQLHSTSTPCLLDKEPSSSPPPRLRISASMTRRTCLDTRLLQLRLRGMDGQERSEARLATWTMGPWILSGSGPFFFPLKPVPRGVFFLFFPIGIVASIGVHVFSNKTFSERKCLCRKRVGELHACRPPSSLRL